MRLVKFYKAIMNMCKPIWEYCFGYRDEIEYQNYKDYILNHNEYIKIKVSILLLNEIKKGDVVVLASKYNDKETQFKCLVVRKGSDYIYVQVLDKNMQKKLSFKKL